MKYFVFISIILFGFNFLSAQETKEEIQEKAQTFFANGHFLEATPLFLRLLSLEPKNLNYNYKYGTCLLYSADKKEAFKYLNYSIEKGSEVEPEAYYYLGKAYHFSYRFNKAIENYEKYKEKSGNRTLNHLQVDRNIEMCENGKSIFTNVSETIVLEKSLIDLKSFFRIYDLKDIGGDLIVTEDFQNREDKRRNHVPLIHFPANSDYIFYSSYGTNNKHKDIFYRSRKPDGSWSKENPVRGKVNSSYNEDFPYMHPNGKYLYFSSEGHKSIGGYDVFRSLYDSASNSFGEPENMNISISSPDNDFLYIVDSLERYAYFASQRESELSKVHVYKVRVERLPMQMIVIKGDFYSEIDPSQKLISIRINDAKGKFVGDYKSNSNGEYSIQLPKSGRYEFNVIMDNKENSHSAMIHFPAMDEFKPIKQRITEVEKKGAETMLFTSILEGEVENSDELLAAAIERKATMEINKEHFNLDSLDNVQEGRKSFEEVGLSSYSTLEIHDLVKSKYEDLSTRQASTNTMIQKSKLVLQNGAKSIQNAERKSDSLIQLSEKDLENSENKRWIRLANEELIKSDGTKKEMISAEIILSYLENDLKEKEVLLSESKIINEKIEKLTLKENDALAKVLLNHQEFISNSLLKSTKTDAHFEYLASINEELRSREKLIERKNNLIKQEKDAQEQVNQLKSEHKNTSTKNQKRIGLELSKAEIQLENLKNEIEFTEKEFEEKEELALRKDMLQQINQNNSDQKSIDQPSTTETVSLEDKVEKHTKSSNVGIANIHTKRNTQRNIKATSPTPTLALIDPRYAQEIEKIKEEIKNGKQTEQALIKRNYQAVLTVQTQKKQTVQQKKENPGDEFLEERIVKLRELENQLYEEITSLESELKEAKEKQSASSIAVNYNHTDETSIIDSSGFFPKGTADILTSKEQKNLISLLKKKEKLELEFTDSNADQSSIKKEIDKIDNTLFTEGTKVLQKSLETIQPGLIKESKKLNQHNSNEISSLQVQQSLIKIDLLMQEASHTSDSKSAHRLLKEAYNLQEKSSLIIEETKKQRHIDNYITSISIEQNLEHIAAETIAITEDDIIIEQEIISLELLKVEKHLTALIKSSLSAKRNEKEANEYNQDQLNEIKTGLETKFNQNKQVLDQNKAQSESDASKGIHPEAIQNTLTFKEEVQIAQSEEYLKQFENSSELGQSQKTLSNKEAQFKTGQNKLKTIYKIIKESEDFSENEKESINQQLQKLNTTKEEIKEARNTVIEQQNKITESLPADSVLRDKTENMIAREVPPLENTPIKKTKKDVIKSKIELKRELEHELAAETDEERFSSDNSSITILKKRKNEINGMVFHVQIGVLNEIVTDEALKEFSPIYGERVNAKSAKYMVGKFSNLDEAKEGCRKVRTLGYADAFVVVYCDDERISLSQAVKMIDAGTCIPIQNTVKNSALEGDDTTDSEIHEIDELSYNKSVGAPKADITETKQGLFYTVQVGVFNTPAAAAHLNNFPSLITQRLPNGQIRYSEGMFNSAEEAKQPRQVVISKGVDDAYIVAYYAGQRISIEVANKILAENGEKVLELKTPTSSRP